MDLIEMISAKAVVSHLGILFEGFYYTTTYAIRNRWFEVSLTRGSWEIEIEYNPFDLNRVYYRDNETNEYSTCYRLQDRSTLAGDKLVVYHKLLQELKFNRRKKYGFPDRKILMYYILYNSIADDTIYRKTQTSRGTYDIS